MIDDGTGDSHEDRFLAARAQKGEREEALEIARWIVKTTEANPTSHAGIVARALLSSSKAEGEMRELLRACVGPLKYAYGHVSSVTADKVKLEILPAIDAILTPKEGG